MSDQSPAPSSKAQRGPAQDNEPSDGRPVRSPGAASTGSAVRPTVAEPTAQGPDAQQQPPARRGMRGSIRSMIISMVVVLAVVLVWMAMVPRVSSVSTPVTDMTGTVRENARAQHWDLAVADGLPSGWEPTNVRMLRPAHSPVTWQAGYTGPDNAYAALLQTRHGNSSWVAERTGDGKKVGTETIDGITWTKRQQSSNDQLSLVRSAPLAGLATVVTGTATWEQLKTFAAALVPYRKSSLAQGATGRATP